MNLEIKLRKSSLVKKARDSELSSEKKKKKLNQVKIEKKNLKLASQKFLIRTW
jgi:hypothetical protein